MTIQFSEVYQNVSRELTSSGMSWVRFCDLID